MAAAVAAAVAGLESVLQRPKVGIFTIGKWSLILPIGFPFRKTLRERFTTKGTLKSPKTQFIIAVLTTLLSPTMDGIETEDDLGASCFFFFFLLFSPELN